MMHGMARSALVSSQVAARSRWEMFFVVDVYFPCCFELLESRRCLFVLLPRLFFSPVFDACARLHYLWAPATYLTWQPAPSCPTSFWQLTRQRWKRIKIRQRHKVCLVRLSSLHFRVHFVRTDTTSFHLVKGQQKSPDACDSSGTVCKYFICGHGSLCRRNLHSDHIGMLLMQMTSERRADKSNLFILCVKCICVSFNFWLGDASE